MMKAASTALIAVRARRPVFDLPPVINISFPAQIEKPSAMLVSRRGPVVGFAQLVARRCRYRRRRLAVRHRRRRAIWCRRMPDEPAGTIPVRSRWNLSNIRRSVPFVDGETAGRLR